MTWRPSPKALEAICTEISRRVGWAWTVTRVLPSPSGQKSLTVWAERHAPPTDIDAVSLGQVLGTRDVIITECIDDWDTDAAVDPRPRYEAEVRGVPLPRPWGTTPDL